MDEVKMMDELVQNTYHAIIESIDVDEDLVRKSVNGLPKEAYAQLYDLLTKSQRDYESSGTDWIGIAESDLLIRGYVSQTMQEFYDNEVIVQSIRRKHRENNYDRVVSYLRDIENELKG
jgi:hypothetical protein